MSLMKKKIFFFDEEDQTITGLTDETIEKNR